MTKLIIHVRSVFAFVFQNRSSYRYSTWTNALASFWPKRSQSFRSGSLKAQVLVILTNSNFNHNDKSATSEPQAYTVLERKKHFYNFSQPGPSFLLLIYLYSTVFTKRSADPQTTLLWGPGPRFEPRTGETIVAGTLITRPPHKKW